MRIVDFQIEPVSEFPYLNAGRGSGQFYEARLPVHHARVDRLPDGVSALVAAADLQGRERFQDSRDGSIRLLGEALPRRLANEVLPALQIDESARVIALLAGDFYTVPALDKRGGTGDVTDVWLAFAEFFNWVAGIPGNHDTFGEPPQRRPRFASGVHYLDGDVAEICGLRVAGIGGIIGNATKVNRRSEHDYLATLKQLLQSRPHVFLMHEGPDGQQRGQPGISQVRELLIAAGECLVIRGHAHWEHPLAEFPSGLQVLNVDARVVVLTT